MNGQRLGLVQRPDAMAARNCLRAGAYSSLATVTILLLVDQDVVPFIYFNS